MNYAQLLRSEPRPLMFAMTHSFFSCYGQSHFLAIFSLFIFQNFKITNTAFGTLYAFATLMSAFVLPVIGPWIDKVDVRKYGVGIFFGLGLGLLLFIFSNTWPFLFVSLFFLRLCGQGLCTHVNGVCTARYFGKNRGKALSLTNIGFPLSEGLFTPLMALMLTSYGAPTTLWSLFSLLIVAYLPLTLMLTRKNKHFNHPQNTTEESDSHTSEKNWTPEQVLRHNVFYLLITHSIFPAFSLSGFLIYQTSYAQTKGWPLQTIALSMSLFAVGRLLSAFATGPLVDRLGALKLFPFYQFPLALSFLSLWFFNHPAVASFGLFLSGLTVGAAAPIKSSMWAELYGVGHLGAIKSLFATIIVVVTSVSPLFFGFMIDQQWHIHLLFLLSLMSLLTTGLGVWALKIHHQQLKNA